jgi:hypothetical protein
MQTFPLHAQRLISPILDSTAINPQSRLHLFLFYNTNLCDNNLFLDKNRTSKDIPVDLTSPVTLTPFTPLTTLMIGLRIPCIEILGYGGKERLPGSRDYVFCITIARGLGPWDEVHRLL